MAPNLLIQLIELLGTVLYFLSYQCRSTRNLFRVQFLSYLFYTVHLFLLGAVTGGVSYLINTFRSVCLGSGRSFAQSWKMGTAICLMQAACLVLTWESWISVLPVAANIAATLAGYTRNAKTIRYTGMLINSPLWIVYNLCVGSWAGVLDE